MERANHIYWRQIYEAAKQWTMEAGQKLKESLEETLIVEYKTSAADLVTEKDREMETFFIERINESYPSHTILGEEGMSSRTEAPYEQIVWVIDPIDGTTNFVHQKKNFSISIGIYENGEPRIGIIYDPVHEECFHALVGEGAFLNEKQLPVLEPTTVDQALIGVNSLWLIPNRRFDHKRFQALVRHVRGSRSLGSAALEIASVACGRLDGYLTLRLSPWDYAAGLVILGELGARITTVHNQSIDIFAEQSSVFVARPGLHEQILDEFLLSKEAPK